MTFRMAASDFAVLEAAAKSVNVPVGALARECAVRHAPALAREVSAGRLKLSRRSAATVPPSPSPAAPGLGGIVRASKDPSIGARFSKAGVKTGRELMLERQRKLNERRGS